MRVNDSRAVVSASICSSGTRRNHSAPDSIELNKANLVGNWIYSSGAKPNAQATLVRLAVRVYQGGQQFVEFANPSTLLRRSNKGTVACARELVISGIVIGGIAGRLGETAFSIRSAFAADALKFTRRDASMSPRR